MLYRKVELTEDTLVQYVGVYVLRWAEVAEGEPEVGFVPVGNEEPEWTEEWPTEPGYYWFYGWAFKNRDREPEMHLVRAHRTANSIAFVTNGHFLWSGEAYGVWTETELPSFPTQEEIEDGQEE